MRAVAAICAIMMGVLLPAHGLAITLSFEEAPADRYFEYCIAHNIAFGRAWTVADHSGSAWGPPRSGDNVLVVGSTSPVTAAVVKFGYYEYGFHFTPIYSLSAYFSTELDTLIRLSGQTANGTEVASAVVGDSGGAWTNVFVDLRSDTPMVAVAFSPISSADALFHVCADDMTIEFVPEPSTLLALLSGLATAGVMGVRRRR